MWTGKASDHGKMSFFGTLIPSPFVSSIAGIDQMSPYTFCPLTSSSLSLLAYRAPHLVVFCDSGIELYDADQAKWIQTIPIRKVCACETDAN